MVYRHWAYFARVGGQCLWECDGQYPRPPSLPVDWAKDRRDRALNEWAQRVRPALPTHLVPEGGYVCLDVTQFGWPVGDHIWHVWNDVDRMLDWPDDHLFIQVDMSQFAIVGNQRSHRPIREALPGQRIFDITGTPLARFHGRLFGFLRRVDDRWTLLPSLTLPAEDRFLLSEAKLDLSPVVAPIQAAFRGA